VKWALRAQPDYMIRWEELRHREALMQLAYFRGSVLIDKGLESMEGDQVVLSEQLLYGPD
jgi:hypothetical protein